jgi:hypothetical protein
MNQHRIKVSVMSTSGNVMGIGYLRQAPVVTEFSVATHVNYAYDEIANNLQNDSTTQLYFNEDLGSIALPSNLLSRCAIQIEFVPCAK